MMSMYVPLSPVSLPKNVNHPPAESKDAIDWPRTRDRWRDRDRSRRSERGRWRCAVAAVVRFGEALERTTLRFERRILLLRSCGDISHGWTIRAHNKEHPKKRLGVLLRIRRRPFGDVTM